MLAVFVLAFVFKRNEIEMELISVKYVVWFLVLHETCEFKYMKYIVYL
jgi:hypothetical protein